MGKIIKVNEPEGFVPFTMEDYKRAWNNVKDMPYDDDWSEAGDWARRCNIPESEAGEQDENED